MYPRFFYHPGEDALIGGSNWIVLIAYIGVIIAGVLVVIENFAVSASHIVQSHTIRQFQTIAG